jgi:hypothetical protein
MLAAHRWRALSERAPFRVELAGGGLDTARQIEGYLWAGGTKRIGQPAGLTRILTAIMVAAADGAGWKAGGVAAEAIGLVEITGENAPVVERLREPLRRALAGRPASYAVRIETAERVGEVLVAITGHKGRLPLLFAYDELEPGYVFGVVSDTVDRFGL